MTTICAQRNLPYQLRIMAAAEDLESLGKFQWQSVFHLLHSQHKDNSGQLEVQRQAVRFIGNLSIHERNKASLVAEGVVEPLFLALQLGEAEAVRLAALAVANLSTLEKNRTLSMAISTRATTLPRHSIRPTRSIHPNLSTPLQERPSERWGPYRRPWRS